MTDSGVVVVGSINRDYVCRVDALPMPGETVIGGTVLVGAGGKGGNQAVAAAYMGIPTAMVARVGDDDDGRALCAGLAAAGVDTAAVAVARDVRTGTAFVFVAADGENSIVVAPGANATLTPSEVAASLRQRLTPDTVLVTQAEIPLATMFAAITVAGELGARAVVNLAPFHPLPDDMLGRCDPLVLNQTEAGSLLSSEVAGPDDALAAARSLVTRVPSVVITLGADGAVFGEADHVEHVASRPVEVVDSTGAGDAFTGVLAAALSRGAAMAVAVRMGLLAGSHAVTLPGAQASYPRAADLASSAARDPFGERQGPTS